MSEKIKSETSDNKQYIYSIGYGTYEESEYDYLTHEQSFTSEHIHELVEEAVVKVIKNRKKGDYISTYQHIHNKVIDILVNNKGFSRLQTQGEWVCFGWASLFKYDWKEMSNDTNKSLVKAIRKAGFTEADDSFLQQDKKWNK